MYFIKITGETIPSITVEVQIIFHATVHSIPTELNNICVPTNPIAVNPGIKIPIIENIIVGFKKSKFMFFNSIVVYYFFVFSSNITANVLALGEVGD